MLFSIHRRDKIMRYFLNLAQKRLFFSSRRRKQRMKYNTKKS